MQWFWSPPKQSLSLFPLFPHLFPMKWWDLMPWSSFFECWVLSQLFHSPFHFHHEWYSNKIIWQSNIIIYDKIIFISYQKHPRTKEWRYGICESDAAEEWPWWALGPAAWESQASSLKGRCAPPSVRAADEPLWHLGCELFYFEWCYLWKIN